jgi:hypothetical protein
LLCSWLRTAKLLANKNIIKNETAELINLAGKNVAIDGVIGTNSINAIKELTNSQTISNKNILPVLAIATPNVRDNAKILNVSNAAVAQSNAAAASDTNKDKKTDTKNVINYTNGDKFEGKILNGRPVEGTYTYKSGTTFTGTFYDGTTVFKFGTFKSVEGWTYIGGFNAKGQMEGDNSTYINKKGQTIIGNFKAAKPVGATFAQLNSGDISGTSFKIKTSKATLDILAVELKNLLNDKNVKGYTPTNKQFKKEGNGIVFNMNNNTKFKTSVSPEALTLTSGYRNYEGNKIFFRDNNLKSKYSIVVQ